MGKIKVMIIDDHPTVRMGIEKLLENKDDIEVVASIGDVNQALDFFRKTVPDVVLVDIALDDEMSGIDFIRAAGKRYPGVKLLVHTMFDENVYAERTLRAGARGYIQKSEAPDRIVSGIRNIINGDLILSDRIKDKMIVKMVQSREESLVDSTEKIEGLTNRELEIFQLFGHGHSIREIAGILNLSQNTIETHRRNIREKLNLSSNNQLIRSAVEWLKENKK